MTTTNVRKLNYLRKRKKNTKAEKCKFEGCLKALREENKSGYCGMHQTIMNSRASSKKKREMSGNIYIKKEIFLKFKEYCGFKGYVLHRKLEIIIENFLKEEDLK